jgi:hypothetical protein
MWLPAWLVPAALARDPWTRHLVARLMVAAAAAATLAAVPAIVPALAAWTDAGCLLQALAGLPCPGCGVTRSLLALAGGDVAGAVRANPAGVGLAAGLAGQSLVAAAVLLGGGGSGAGSAWLTGLDRMAIAALLAVWVARLAGLGW